MFEQMFSASVEMLIGLFWIIIGAVIIFAAVSSRTSKKS
jgi:hypothetical protein